MDPISAISCVTTIVGIINAIAKGALALSDFQSRYKIADLKVVLLIGQLSTLKAALTQIGYLVEDVDRAPRDWQVLSDLSTSLSSLETIIAVLDKRLSEIHRNSENGLSGWTRVGLVWDEQTMRDYLSLLDHQVNALGLLLTALQCRTTFEQKDMLSARESRHILDLARDETSSLRWLVDTESIGTLESSGTQDLETIHARFDFDSEVFTSRAYQVATRDNMISALTGYRSRGIFHTTNIIGGAHQAGFQEDDSGTNRPTHSGIAVNTVVDIVSTAPSVVSSDDLQDNTSETGLVVQNWDPDSELPHFPVHTSKYIGVLALRLGQGVEKTQLDQPIDKTLPTAKGMTLRRLFKPSTRLSFPIRSNNEMAQVGKIRSIRTYKPVKILLVGISESGKSTLAKAMRAGYGDIDEHWLRLYRSTIINNTIDVLKWLISSTQLRLDESNQ